MYERTRAEISDVFDKFVARVSHRICEGKQDRGGVLPVRATNSDFGTAPHGCRGVAFVVHADGSDRKRDV